MSNNTVHIKPSQRGSFTKWASEHNMSVKQATQTVLAHKDRYSSAIVKKANFSRNFGGNKYGGNIGNPTLMGYMLGGNLASSWFKPNPNDTGVLEKRMGGFLTGKTQMNNTPRDMYALGGQIDVNNFGRTYGKDMLVGGATGLASSVGGNAGDAAYNTTMGVVGSAGPVGAAIGTITGIGDSIGNPIRQKNEAVGQYGGLQHMGAAERSANLGASLNPLKAITMTLGDKEASSREKWAAGINTALPGMGAVLGFGKARAQRLNDQSKSAFNKQLTLNANNELNMMYGYMDLGGPMGSSSQHIVDYKGATHEQGGIKVDSNGNPTAKTGRPAIAEVEDNELKWNDYVFSNTIVYGKRK